MFFCFFFFFSSRRRHTRWTGDWSSDVCSSDLVATTDAGVEGVHFDLRRFSPEDVGWKSLAVNLSDLAAAGARPRWFLCALGIPRGSRAIQLARRISRG